MNSTFQSTVFQISVTVPYWQKEIIGKNKCKNNNIPKNIIIGTFEIKDANFFAEKFNEYFVNLESNLASEI